MRNALIFETKKDTIHSIKWQTNKVQELFLYLLQHRGMYVERETLIEVIWYQKDLINPTALLYSNISMVRKALEELAEYLQIKTHMNGYILKLTNVKVDLLDWEKKGQALPSLTEENVKCHEAFVKGFDGNYLAQYDFYWLEAKREQLIRFWKEKINELIYYYEETGKYQQGIQLLNEINQQMTVVDERLYFSVMKFYHKINDFDGVAKQYCDLFNKLSEQGGLSPSMAVKEWYRQNVLRKMMINLNGVYEKI